MTSSAVIAALRDCRRQDPFTPLRDSLLLGFDTETTGLSSSDAIVSAALVLRTPAAGRDGDAALSWTINPHRPLSPAAAAVNGFTDEELRRCGMEPQDALDTIAAIIALAQSQNIPLLAYNAPFDVRMLRNDLRRWHLPTVADRLAGADDLFNDLDTVASVPLVISSENPLVVDPLVLDRAVSDRDERRRLEDTAFYYGVSPRGDFHDATIDAIAAMDVLASLCRLYPDVGSLPLAEVGAWEWDTCQRYERRQGCRRSYR
ncbi:MAG: DNA polymerase III subunit epsilon [Aeriscardovia sp.]|nr:DNA polymerase III subunit epsilon [Aeriscardovia sp.]